MKKAYASYAACLAAILLSACQWFSTSAYRAEIPADQDLPPGAVVESTRDDGVRVVMVPAVKGGIDQAADAAAVAGAAGVPWAGVASGALSIIGIIGTFFTRRDKRLTLESGIDLFAELRPKVASMTDEEDLKLFLVDWAGKNKFAGDVKNLYDRLHAAMKK